MTPNYTVTDFHHINTNFCCSHKNALNQSELTSKTSHQKIKQTLDEYGDNDKLWKLTRRTIMFLLLWCSLLPL